MKLKKTKKIKLSKNPIQILKDKIITNDYILNFHQFM